MAFGWDTKESVPTEQRGNSKMKTKKARLSSFVNGISARVLGDPKLLRKLFKPIVVKIIGAVNLGRGIRVKIAGKYNVRLSPDFYFSNWENFGSGHNSGFQYVMDKVQDDTILFDIGAHIGLVALPAATTATSGSVHAFEPSEINNRYLELHKSLNSATNLNIVNTLVGETSAEYEFFEDSTDVNAMGSIVGDIYENKNFKKVMKSAISIDDYVAKTQAHPNMIKIDVEGAELDVLKGARKTLQDHKPILILSLHPSILNAANVSVDEVLSLVRNHGYSLFEHDGTTPYQRSTNEVICEIRNE